MMNLISKHLGLVAVIAVVLVTGTWMNESRHKSEPLKPTTITSNAVWDCGGVTLSSKSCPTPPGGRIKPPHEQTEEEVMAAIVRNACLRQCPSGSVPVYIGEDVTGFFNFETSHLTNFSEGDRLNL